MTHPTLTPAIALVLLVAFVGPSNALHCNGEVTTVTTAATTLYLDDRSSQAGPLNHWLYLESNGVAGLQSGGEGPFIMQDCYVVCLGDACAHADPDLLIF